MNEKNDSHYFLIENYKPLREIVFEKLRDMIVNGDLRPGERLMEIKLAEMLGVSRTPIREAIRKLELEGLVVMLPRKGAYVADISKKEIMDVLEIRAALDKLAAGLATQRMTKTEKEELKKVLASFEKNFKLGNIEGMITDDIRLHDIIYIGAKNEKLQHIINNLREQITRFRIIYLKEIYRKNEKLLDEHREIVDAILSGDIEKAQKMAEEHIKNQEMELIKSLKF
ncbi:GntR family transcriptional regulator [Caldicellulosiruptor changbaiensis]|uniref:Transcriptional regulator, GntR family n=2 Tax=Caldicellulosiruptor TaxID=44000 RepID=A4XLL7_CALS8|nr:MULTISPECIES: GntR family transcriptional regulator [Caldicellulosiruptor]ABP67802.1 transcriptional regulator, GntR family [Caldicellulosiruptor saccharolyticus DSM 8903]AZT91629.1 GntR family transcriptional regulator [Caldicellulosiruptor changbaiensis]